MAGVMEQAHAGLRQFDALEMAAVQTVQIRDAEIELVARQAFEYLFRTQGIELETQLRVAPGHVLDQAHRVEAGQRHHAQAQGPDQLPAAGGGFRVQPFLGRQQAACPGQYALAGLGEAFEALAASHQFQAEFFLQAAQAHGQGRLGDVAARGGLAEVAGFVEGAEEFQLLDVHRRFRGGVSPNLNANGRSVMG